MNLREEIENIVTKAHCCACDLYQCDFGERKEEVIEQLLELFEKEKEK